MSLPAGRHRRAAGAQARLRGPDLAPGDRAGPRDAHRARPGRRRSVPLAPGTGHEKEPVMQRYRSIGPAPRRSAARPGRSSPPGCGHSRALSGISRGDAEQSWTAPPRPGGCSSREATSTGIPLTLVADLVALSRSPPCPARAALGLEENLNPVPGRRVRHQLHRLPARPRPLAAVVRRAVAGHAAPVGGPPDAGPRRSRASAAVPGRWTWRLCRREASAMTTTSTPSPITRAHTATYLDRRDHRHDRRHPRRPRHRPDGQFTATGSRTRTRSRPGSWKAHLSRSSSNATSPQGQSSR